MKIKDFFKPLIPDYLLMLLKKRNPGIEKFAFDKNLDVATDIQRKYHYNGDLLNLFVTNKDIVVHKWHHYIPLYERYFSPYRGKEVRFLEIGVSKGGSLQLWRKYFGEKAILFGIDIDPECAKLNGQCGQVRIGSQADKGFLDAVIKEMGGVDIVLDDGSHQMAHIHASLAHLFPHVSDGGLYIIEDLHTAYWKSYGGGYGSKQNFFAYVMELVDDIHHWYHTKKLNHSSISKHCSGIHIHDSMVVIDKSIVYQPTHSKIQ